LRKWSRRRIRRGQLLFSEDAGFAENGVALMLGESTCRFRAESRSQDAGDFLGFINLSGDLAITADFLF
jgi:hypothetical protein